jgi:DNA-binding beta-propeller fold protein YncE
VADTWNSRIQIFSPDSTGTKFSLLRAWEVSAWSGQSLDNKPFIAAAPGGRLFVADPEGYRVLKFDQEGKLVMGWGDYSSESDGFGLVSGVAVAPDGSVWVSDGVNNRILKFDVPAEQLSQ